MSGFDWGSIAETEEQARQRALLLRAMERQRKRMQELQAEEAARTEEADPYLMGAKLADPAYYQDRLKVDPTAAERAEDLVFGLLANGGMQASFAPGSALGASLYDRLGSLLSTFDRTEPS